MSSKLAIITDVHGNSAALKAVLNKIDSESNIQHIYCLGDMVAIGHETNEVLEILFNRNDVSMITGNHEEAVLAILDGKEPASYGEEREHHYWIAAGLDKRYIPSLKELPKKLSVVHEGKKLLLTHYHMDVNDKLLPIDMEPSREKLDKLYEESSHDVVCFGHQHNVHHFESSHRIYLNPGSLGCHHKPFARYAVLNIKEGVEVHLKETPYENKDFLSLYNHLEVPAKDFIFKIFHGNQHSTVL